MCPCCGLGLKVIGSRSRIYLDDDAKRVMLVIRRLRCKGCSRVHHELPDILVPYKRYKGKCIESVLSQNTLIDTPADESTIKRWRQWFRDIAPYWVGCLDSLSQRYGTPSAAERSCLPRSLLQRIYSHVGKVLGWLSRVVRPIANENLWVHTTRSAFLS